MILDSEYTSNSEFLTSLRRVLQDQLDTVSRLCESGNWSEESKKMAEDSRLTQERLLRAVNYACELEAKLLSSEQKLQGSEQKLRASEELCSDLQGKLGKLKTSYDQFNALFRDAIS